MRYSWTLLLLLISNWIASAQQDSIPFDLTKKYISGELGDFRSILTGEAKEQDFNPKKISSNAEISFETLLCNANKAVIAVAIQENKDHTDLYVFWTRDNEWKINALRALWLPGMFYMMLDKYKDLDEIGIKHEYEKMFNDLKKRSDTISDEKVVESIGTLKDFRYEINNMKLTIASDKDLMEHFNINQDKFNALLTTVQKNALSSAEPLRVSKNSQYKNEMQDILISSISNLDDNNCISFMIGGMIDNSVGYFHCENPDNVPAMSDNRYIMIRCLGNGWYLYKTT
jgi:hypothetical protein